MKKLDKRFPLEYVEGDVRDRTGIVVATLFDNYGRPHLSPAASRQESQPLRAERNAAADELGRFLTDAANVLHGLVESFPGLVDGERAVPGADLVAELSALLRRCDR